MEMSCLPIYDVDYKHFKITPYLRYQFLHQPEQFNALCPVGLVLENNRWIKILWILHIYDGVSTIPDHAQLPIGKEGMVPNLLWSSELGLFLNETDFNNLLILHIYV